MNKLLTLILTAGACFAQVETIQNGYPTNPGGRPYFPDSMIELYSCTIPLVNNVPISLFYYQYRAAGAHTHETDATRRNKPVILGNPTKISGAGGTTGCVIWEVTLNGYAGTYTFFATSPGRPTQGINFITKYYTVVNGEPLYLKKYVGGAGSENYDALPGGPINKLDTLHQDSRHLSGPGPWTHLTDSARYVASDTYNTFIGLSNLYLGTTILQGDPDKLDITRISLPDGGVYDNDTYGTAPGLGNGILDWDTRPFEEHSRGTEADIVIPIGTLKQDIFFATITTAGCALGIFKPTGESLGTPTQVENYWRINQEIAHVSCKPGRSLKGGYHPAQ